ncbi:Isoeugenol synthase 1 [Hibiscus syriacus]|uniref:Isoeugenol synthase 1 n=1 Tax=Hibiscus syriacus TaxID=106335 RepID=A0A6A2Z4Z8_HIBSY|nr:eugenol synthase 1-like [Hibiscus syriacus]KAE8687071.1 Isoeugenol synthase 1 [Hibiscus syriacus]
MDKEATGSAEETKTKTLIFGGTGYLGTYIVKASIKLRHQTFVYARPITPQSSPHKINLHHEFQSLGVTIIEGELDEHEKIVATLHRVDVVISSLPFPQVPDQIHIIEAIKVAGNIKRFIPSEFGVEEDRLSFLPPFEACLDKKRKIRREVEASGIPYTYISANCFGAYFLNYLLRPHEEHEDVIVYGSGEAKVLFNYEEDIAEYTIKVANDPRTCNKIVIYQMPMNILSQMELISLWQSKTGRSFRKIHVPEEELVKLTETLPFPDNVPASILYSIFVKGDCLNYELREDDLEASCLYPDYKYTTVDQLLDVFLVDPPKPARATF